MTIQDTNKKTRKALAHELSEFAYTLARINFLFKDRKVSTKWVRREVRHRIRIARIHLNNLLLIINEAGLIVSDLEDVSPILNKYNIAA